MARCEGPRAPIVRLFLVFTYIWHEDVAKLSKVPGAPRNANSARVITWLVGVTIHIVPFFNNNLPPPRQFLRDKILLKYKLAWRSAMEQIIEFELSGSGPPGRTCTPKLVILMAKQKSIKGYFRVDYCSLLKYWKRQCILLPPTWAKSLTKFNFKIQDFKRVLVLNCE